MIGNAKTPGAGDLVATSSTSMDEPESRLVRFGLGGVAIREDLMDGGDSGVLGGAHVRLGGGREAAGGRECDGGAGGEGAKEVMVVEAGEDDHEGVRVDQLVDGLDIVDRGGHVVLGWWHSF